MRDTMRDSTKDWPADLRLSAAIDRLARAIYQTRAFAFGVPDKWSSEPPSKRAEYRALAVSVLEEVRPAKVITKPDYFRIAVETARDQFGKERP